MSRDMKSRIILVSIISRCEELGSLNEKARCLHPCVGSSHPVCSTPLALIQHEGPQACVSSLLLWSLWTMLSKA